MADLAVEHTTYTWDPVSAAWVHERGPQIPPPPRPPDVHALQSYFFDEDSKEWIRTVLAPMGRELAARWQGAHKIPDAGTEPAAKGKKSAAKGAPAKKSSSTGIVFGVVLLIVIFGGIVAASQSGLLASSSSATPTGAASVVPDPTAAPVVPTAAATDVAPATAAPTAPTAATVAPTRAPAPPPVTLPAGPRATLPDGTVVVYTGPTTATRGGFLPASFTVVAPNGRPATGELTIVLGDLTKDPRLVSGLLDANGKIALDVPATLPLGQYPLSVVFKGSRAQLATITLR